MDAPITGRPFRPPSHHARHAALGLALVLFAAAGSRADPAGRFDMNASIQSRPAVHAAGGFQLEGTLTPAHSRVEGGGYSVDAVAAPAGACGGSDVIFSNGFEATFLIAPADA